MEHARSQGRRGLRRAVALAVALLVPAAVIACSSSPALVAAGGECFAASDCQPGLVCVPQKNGPRVCSSDLTQITGRPPADPDAAMPETSVPDAVTDAPVTDAPTADAPADTSIPDAAEAG